VTAEGQSRAADSRRQRLTPEACDMLPEALLSFSRVALPPPPQAAIDFIAQLPPRIVPFPARQLANRHLGPVLGSTGSLEIRLARTAREVRRAQRLRYQVFYEEMAAAPDPRCRFLRRDIDAYDAVCDHLIVVDKSRMDNRPGRPPMPLVVGTYRLLRQDQARGLGFYTQGEFDIDALIARHPSRRFVELGRSCVMKGYRDKRTVELLWHGIWAYVRHHRIDVMFGCASLEGTDPATIAPELGLLNAQAGERGEWTASAHPARHVRMDHACLDPKAALKRLPPLLKGYLRIGAVIGDGAVVDRQFGTTDVLVILPVSRINPRYVTYYGAEGQRYAA
jgi:L-ornithine Nalpha-acyltransferase